MRKKHTLLLLFVCMLFMGMPRLAAQRVPWSEVPKEVVESFYLAHPNSEWKIVHWELAEMGYVSRMNLEPKEITSLFQANGEWVSTRWVVPESQLPMLAHDFISEKYAFYTLRSCTYEENRWSGRHYYALFSIYGIEGYLTEVCFDLKGNVKSIDGKEIENPEEFEPLTEEEVLKIQQEELLAKEQAKLLAQDRERSLKDSLKQQKKRDKDIYKPQTKREFIAAKVSVQSKSAQKNIEKEESGKASAPKKREEIAVVPPKTTEPVTPTPVTPVAPAPPARMENMVSNMKGGSFTTARISVKSMFPAAIQKVFDHRFPKAENVKQYRDTNGDYRAIFNNFGQRAEAVILADGTHTTTALYIGKSDVSYPIMQYILNSPEKYKFETGKRVVYEARYRQRFSAAEKPQNFYEIIVWVKDKDTKERMYYLLTFDHKAHFVSSVPYDYSKLR